MKKMLFATVAALSLTSAANAATLVVDVTGAQSFFDFLTPGNQVNTFNIGAGSHVTGVSYDVTINAFTPSWLSEATLAFTNGAITTGVFLTPGIGEDAPGTQSFADSIDLVANGLDFFVDADGILRLEYWESFDDAAPSPDAIWTAGTLTFTYDLVGGAVPEPSTWAMMIFGFGMAGAAMRRRRQNVRISYA